ncbi:hydroxymethylglutaryl-CoA lyase [Aspergillus terreus]|nr:hydroxymethylglutaryl-CoA lyase [Aspergillus terreus]
MKNPRGAVRIVEVGPRDGLQNIKDPVATSVKLELIRRLRESGLSTIELTSIVSPRAVPQLADCREVLGDQTIKQLQQHDGLRFPVLVPNPKGLDIALEYGVKEVAVFVSATEGFSKANINCSVGEGIERASRVAEKAIRNGVAVRGYVSCIFEDPFSGPTEPSAVLRCVKALLSMGCYEVSLGDTTGVGRPEAVRELLTYLVDNSIPVERLAGHFHDTYGHAAANAWEAYTCGIRVFDSSVAGLGGCPFAPGSKGNVATEDLVFMFHNAGVDTGVNLLKLMETGIWISRLLGAKRSCPPKQQQVLKFDQATSVSLPTSQWVPTQKIGNILVYRSGSSVKIVLNRAKTGNTLTHKMILDLTHLIHHYSEKDTISTIVITGKGRFFCMGLEYGKTGPAGESPELKSLTRLLDLLSHVPKMTIASVNGPAFGAGRRYGHLTTKKRGKFHNQQQFSRILSQQGDCRPWGLSRTLRIVTKSWKPSNTELF